MLKEALDDALKSISKPQHILCGPVTYAMYQAFRSFEGRDWRRVKREMNKAAKRARLKGLVTG